MIILVIPAVLLAAVSLASFAGRWVWWLDVLANFRAQYVVVLLVLGLVIAASRWRRTGLVILSVALVNLLFVAPLYVGSPGDPVAGAPDLRVMSLNLLSTNESYNEVIEYIEAAEPDVVLLHEASRPWEVALDSAGLDYEVVRGRSDNLIFGTLVLAREELEAVSYGFAEGAARAIALEFQPEGWTVPVRILSSHPLAPTTADRADLRDAQLAFAADWAAEQEGAFLVVGDLNASPWSWPFRRLVAEGSVRNSQIGFGLQASFPADSWFLLRVPIDHLLHSDELRVRDRHLGPTLGSDHFPLIVDLEHAPSSE
ncbi:MAG TPA: endonuclease/exonuclease/phosphatase family protein [Acidimicrobiia bacterium]|nr:endonuclease/exonuclease/phosphatase family protein [Acidimicrobiia bacterium]